VSDMASQISDDQPPSTEGVPPRVENDIFGTVSGNAVQAGAISGGVHFYVAGSAAASAGLPRKNRMSAWGRVWKIFWGWLVLLILLFLVSGLLSYVINVSVGRGSWGMNLAVDLILLCVVALALVVGWKQTAAQKVSFSAYAWAAVDRCVPGCVKETSTPVLCIIGVVDLFFLLAAFSIKEASESFTAAQGKNGVLILFVTLGVFIFRVLATRRRVIPNASAE
jgi:hypothetical protein